MNPIMFPKPITVVIISSHGRVVVVVVAQIDANVVFI